jgi:hypothetical protein
VPCLPRVCPITCKWVYKIKARLVAHGFPQEQGRDYDETFTHVAHMTIFTLFLLWLLFRSGPSLSLM